MSLVLAEALGLVRNWFQEGKIVWLPCLFEVLAPQTLSTCSITGLELVFSCDCSLDAGWCPRDSYTHPEAKANKLEQPGRTRSLDLDIPAG